MKTYKLWENRKTLIEIIGIIIWLWSVLFLWWQTLLLRHQINQDYNFRRLEFVQQISTNLWKDYSDIKLKLVNWEYITNKDKLLSWIDEFEYLFDLYYRNKLIKESELSMFFKGYIVNTCNDKQVEDTIKIAKGHNWLKQLCYCTYNSEINNKDIYKVNCK